VQETEKDYICSLAKDSGMHTCGSLPPTKWDGRFCNDSVVPGIPVGMDGLSVNGSCINWNQYYTDCRAGEKNPFQGAISFDNIGLAWVAIFLVSFFFFFFLFHFLCAVFRSTCSIFCGIEKACTFCKLLRYCSFSPVGRRLVLSLNR
jgi:hypothetical protein